VNAIPIIALTAHNPDFLFEDYSDAGFNELITKPFSVEKIRARIKDLVH
jgi:CheY-like chemotaxis protein